MNTKKRLINLIIEHFTTQPNKSLPVSTLATKAGISRQYIYQNFEDLIPYIQGKEPVTELIGSDEETIKSLLISAQSTIKKLNTELDSIVNDHKVELITLEHSICTTLMNNDISVHDADEVRITIEKQALQFDHLVSENKRLQTKLNELSIEKTKINSQLQPYKNIIAIKPDLNLAYKSYLKSPNIDFFEEAKDLAIEKSLFKIARLPDTENNRVIIFIERYYNQFEKFLESVKQRFAEEIVVLHLPVHTITEIKLYVKKIRGKGSISLFIPVSDSKATVQAQRKFHFSSVPEFEFESADKMKIPSLSDGFDEICIFRIKQGD